MRRTNLLLFCLALVLTSRGGVAENGSLPVPASLRSTELSAVNQPLVILGSTACATCPPGAAPIAASLSLLTTSAVCELAAAGFQSTTIDRPTNSGGLERVLAAMDKAATGFRSAEADFVWDQFQKVVNDHDIQKGKVYFRRQGQEIQMAADINEPAKKYVIFSGGKVQVYQPGINQITEYNVAKNRAELESFLVLGFGGSGHDLLKQYEANYLGRDEAQGVDAEKLQLIPKSVKVRNNVERILLWIDPARGISVQQQFFEPSGDYRLTKYSDIQLNQKIPDAVFKIKTDGKTKIVSPQG